MADWYPDGSVPVEIADFYSVNPVPSLRYRILVAIPEDTTAEDLNAARTGAASSSVRAIDDLELLTIPEHDVVQVMHHGPFAEEFGSLARLGKFARMQKKHRNGPRHELHLDGFARETPQDRLQRILRDPGA